MYEDLKKKQSKDAIIRAICGMAGLVGLYFIFAHSFVVLTWVSLPSARPAIVAVLSLALFIPVITVVRILKVPSFNGIKRFCKKSPDPEAMMARLEKTWSDGLNFGSGCMDSEYIICLNNMRSKVIPLKNAVWVYRHVSRSSGAVYYTLMVRYSDGDLKNASLGGPYIDGILKYILGNLPDVAVGHEKSLEKLFGAKDMAGLREYAHNQRITAGISLNGSN